MINSKFKRTYNIIFVVLTLVTSLPRIGILVGMCVDFLWGPYEKTDKYIGLAGMFLIIATLLMLVGILCLYSGLKYFLFEPEKSPPELFEIS